MKQFGLIGYPLGHSFSQKFFSRKFKTLGLSSHEYKIFQIEHLSLFPELWLTHLDLVGVNVTVPYKEKVLNYVDQQDSSAVKVGAANVILKREGKLIAFNTDYIAFKESLKAWVTTFSGEALVLGTGGASRAVQVALSDLDIPFKTVSRYIRKGVYTYAQVKKNRKIVDRFKLIINTTPLGMYPNIEECPNIPYEQMGSGHLLYDLVYNPSETKFMSSGKTKGAKVKNGLEMLELQAEHSWKIWNSNGL